MIDHHHASCLPLPPPRCPPLLLPLTPTSTSLDACLSHIQGHPLSPPPLSFPPLLPNPSCLPGSTEPPNPSPNRRPLTPLLLACLVHRGSRAMSGVALSVAALVLTCLALNAVYGNVTYDNIFTLVGAAILLTVLIVRALINRSVLPIGLMIRISRTLLVFRLASGL